MVDVGLYVEGEEVGLEAEDLWSGVGSLWRWSG